ncbi:sel1 repeat family protein [Acinetobacter oleivorans]|uniref:Sel1 repeat family protein n=1 Tax=Acinetobacter oleivorans TaxID=1148157 RepID=A0ABR9NI37_9GAMM|nr:sel1 repeat family protein [Acinetobacter oleivorans]MBE2172189.1 sel1 repeat family protein [Acinetobacter oleivorans]MBJ8496581.1 sel1 repeat family protein [Acinetobacter oleivorans]HBU87176.1 sel1 repeat family protein [Acinetobacter sp.]
MFAFENLPSDMHSQAVDEIEQGLRFEELAVQDHERMQNWLDITPNDRNAMWCYLRAALRGNADASFKLGIGYLNGQFGLDKNYSEAEKWLKKAASQGHPDAEHRLQEAFSKLAFS